MYTVILIHIVHTYTIQVQVVAFQRPSISNRHFKKRQPFLQILVLIAYFRVPDRSRSLKPKSQGIDPIACKIRMVLEPDEIKLL